MVAKEIIGCCGIILVAMLLLRQQAVHLVTILTPTSAPVEYRVKMKNLVMVAKEVNGCYGRTLVAMVTNIELLKD